MKLNLAKEKPAEKWILLGASRGLGECFYRLASERSSSELVRISRKSETSADFSKSENFSEICQQICSLQADRIFYFAGGGPFGNFHEKAWKDHEWALNVNFQFPAFLLHQLLQKPDRLKQIVFVGSSIAEDKPDAKASMYSASKHALKGLITSIQSEMQVEKTEANSMDLRLFSPGYMDTSLLPQHAWPRQRAGLVVSPDKVAEMLWAWIHNADDVGTHFVLKSPS
jgi:short-subunit dehydrogenase